MGVGGTFDLRDCEFHRSQVGEVHLSISGRCKRATGAVVGYCAHLVMSTIRGLGPGAHSHEVMGRLMIHTHRDDKESVFVESASVIGWTPQWWRKLGAFHIVRPLTVGIVHGLAGSAAVALLVLTTIQRTVGHWLSSRFWIRNGRRNDADHSGNSTAVCVFPATLRTIESRPGDGLRAAKPGLWIISVLPHRDCRWPVYKPSELDAAVKGSDW